ncbi:hypothetical protein [Streptomyces sp. NPDC057910]|uniref:hypothetical protein n=1 Tax=Streptomyces sp. NPDC057910 TaxID=3346278 RepID=UPI001DCF56BF|nr:hypothetical protein [Streptomyces sp. MAG02]
MSPRPIIVCSACGNEREHRAHGWCQSCYRRWQYAGRPEGGPPARREIPCGSLPGWDKHIRNGTPPCDECRKVHNATVRDYYRANGRLRQPHEMRQYTDTHTQWSSEEQHAAHVVASRAERADDCRTVLQALGLLAYDVAPQLRIGGAA